MRRRIFTIVVALVVAVVRLTGPWHSHAVHTGNRAADAAANPAPRHEVQPLAWTDRFGDGTPDFLRLTDPADQQALTQLKALDMNRMSPMQAWEALKSASSGTNIEEVERLIVTFGETGTERAARLNATFLGLRARVNLRARRDVRRDSAQTGCRSTSRGCRDTSAPSCAGRFRRTREGAIRTRERSCPRRSHNADRVPACRRRR